MSLPVYFAPLQGYTDVVYRKAHAALFGGIAAYYTPFVRIEKGDFRRKDLRDIDFENNRGVPVVPQAIASESDELRRIVDCMASLGYTRVDINLQKNW
jgi:tRNA-dihydrouridine synthase